MFAEVTIQSTHDLPLDLEVKLREYFPHPSDATEAIEATASLRGDHRSVPQIVFARIESNLVIIVFLSNVKELKIHVERTTPDLRLTKDSVLDTVRAYRGFLKKNRNKLANATVVIYAEKHVVQKGRLSTHVAQGKDELLREPVARAITAVVALIGTLIMSRFFQETAVDLSHNVAGVADKSRLHNVPAAVFAVMVALGTIVLTILVSVIAKARREPQMKYEE